MGLFGLGKLQEKAREIGVNAETAYEAVVKDSVYLPKNIKKCLTSKGSVKDDAKETGMKLLGMFSGMALVGSVVYMFLSSEPLTARLVYGFSFILAVGIALIVILSLTLKVNGYEARMSRYNNNSPNVIAKIGGIIPWDFKGEKGSIISYNTGKFSSIIRVGTNSLIGNSSESEAFWNKVFKQLALSGNKFKTIVLPDHKKLTPARALNTAYLDVASKVCKLSREQDYKSNNGFTVVSYIIVESDNLSNIKRTLDEVLSISRGITNISEFRVLDSGESETFISIYLNLDNFSVLQNIKESSSGDKVKLHYVFVDDMVIPIESVVDTNSNIRSF